MFDDALNGGSTSRTDEPQQIEFRCPVVSQKNEEAFREFAPLKAE